MSHTGHINFSARIDDHSMLLTSRGLVQHVDHENFAVVGLGGHTEDGQLDASSEEIVGMHTSVYRARPAVNAVVHTHSPFLTTFALAHKALPCRYEALVRRGQTGEVPVVPWAPRGSEAFVQGVFHAVGQHPATLALLLANHGLLAFGPSPAAAAKLVVTLEEAAEAELRASAIGGAKDFPPADRTTSRGARG